MVQLESTYLTTRTTFEQAAADNMFEGQPFGHAHDDWVRLLAKRREGDELWNFEPPNDRAHRLWGVALVRDGLVVSTVITAVD